MNTDNFILIGLGANIPHIAGSHLSKNLEKALELLVARGIRINRRSSWYRSSPVPPSGQPWFFNGVAAIEFSGTPDELMGLLHDVEYEMGRKRRLRNESRVIDLDLIAFGRVIISQRQPGGRRSLVLPHPELHKRAFVLRPMAEIVPNWSHPVLAKGVNELLSELPSGQSIELFRE